MTEISPLPGDQAATSKTEKAVSRENVKFVHDMVANLHELNALQPGTTVLTSLLWLAKVEARRILDGED